MKNVMKANPAPSSCKRLNSSFVHAVQAPEKLILEFLKHPCCQRKNCIANICNLPLPTGGYCTGCQPSQSYCIPVDRRTNPEALTIEQQFAENEKKADFINLVTTNRIPWDKYRSNENDEISRAAEKDRVFSDQLVQHFTVLGHRGENGRWSWDNCYYIYLTNGSKVNVCQRAWLAISGVTKGAVEYVQTKIKSGQVVCSQLYDDPNEKIDQKAAFQHFGIDTDQYQSKVRHFCIVDSIPESEGSLVAAAFLCDYFDLVGEAQPDVRAVHYDPITYMELWDTYKEDSFVSTITSDIISYQSFCKLLRDVFPNVKPREYKSVSGKCDICESLRAKTKECKLRSDRLILKRYVQRQNQFEIICNLTDANLI
jgi:hypothetical protein